MFQIWMLAWSILSVTFAGMLIMAILIVPALNSLDMTAIPIAAAIGAALAIPVSYFISKKVYSMTAGREIKGSQD